jgi:glycosyltransferase involved in cell wall biosynthesis
MHVANIIEEGKLGGPQVRIAAVAAALGERVKTTVIMPVENSQLFRQRCDTLGVSYNALPLTRITKEWRVALRYVLFSFFEIISLALLFRRENFDLVHVSGGSWQFKGVLAAKLAGKKVLWHLNDTSMPGFVRKIFALISGLADGFIFASERSRDYYRPLMKANKPEFVVPAPVDTMQFNPEGAYLGDDDLIGRWSGKLVVGTVANINPIKGLETFIRAAGVLGKRNGHFHFVIVGPVFKNQQKYFARLQQLCSQLKAANIEFVGGRSDVRPLLQRFDVYVCCSHAESSPIAVWEAMSMAKPVVSTDVGDVPLYVRDGLSGFIVKVDDAEALAERVERLVDNKELRQQFGVQVREIAVEQLDVTQCAERHMAAYSHMLALR